MSTTNLLLCAVLLLNTAAAAAYLIWGMLTARRTKKGKMLIFMRFFLMLFCPVIGILYFVCSMLFHKLLFHKKVDLSDVIFNKEKIRQVERSDLERERNIAPIEETIAVSDYKNQRQLMMNVLRNDYRDSLGSISLALNSADSEVSHYAASALRDELGAFRNSVSQKHKEMLADEKDAGKTAAELIEQMVPILKQNVFPFSEYATYVHILEDAMHTLCQKDGTAARPVYYEWLVQQLLAVKEYDAAAHWCETARHELAGTLIPYKCLLQLYYTTKDRKRFFDVLEALRQSDIPIDNDTLELFRIFNRI